MLVNLSKKLYFCSFWIKLVLGFSPLGSSLLKELASFSLNFTASELIKDSFTIIISVSKEKISLFPKKFLILRYF